jgi:biotin carboxyl carrier protein
MADPIVTRIDEGVFRVETDGKADIVYVAGPADAPWAFCRGRVYHGPVAGRHANRGASRPQDIAQPLTAPMPATILKVLVQPGNRVKHGDTLLVLEAMKMELPIRAPGDGTVTAVHCREGELVQPDAPLIDLSA